MTNRALDQNLTFDTELTISATTFDGTTKLIGTITNRPVMLLIKNQTNQTVFVSTDLAGTKGTTMVASESIILDCRSNNGQSANMGFPQQTAFYATAPSGTGNVKISVLYAT